MPIAHELHKVIANLLRDHISDPATVLIDPAGDGDQLIPLFTTAEKSLSNRFCCVDALVIIENQIRLVIEVEESDIKPTNIAGKFMTSVLTNFYIHERVIEPIQKSEKVSFLQIVSTEALTELNQKVSQFRILSTAIQNQLPLGNISNYQLYAGKIEDFKPERDLYKKVIEYIQQSIT